MTGWSEELIKKSTVGTSKDYGAIRTPMTEEQLQARITELSQHVVKLGLDKEQIKQEIEELEENIGEINKAIESLSRYDKTTEKYIPPMRGTLNFDRINKKKKAIKKAEQEIADQKEAAGNVEAKQQFLQEQINELKKQL